MLNSELDPKYKLLFDAAVEVLQRNYHPVRHSVAAAVLTASGNIYAGVNVESSGHGVCAEPIALGSALVAKKGIFRQSSPSAGGELIIEFYRPAAAAGRCCSIMRRKSTLSIRNQTAWR